MRQYSPLAWEDLQGIVTSKVELLFESSWLSETLGDSTVCLLVGVFEGVAVKSKLVTGHHDCDRERPLVLWRCFSGKFNSQFLPLMT